MTTTAKKRYEEYKSPANREVAQKTTCDSKNYDGIVKFQGVDPKVQLDNLDKRFTKEAIERSERRVTIDEYCHLIYGWLLLNPTMLSVSDFYEYPKDNAPYIYSLDEVILADSDEIYNLLQDRISKMMLRRQIDREAALALLREKYGWERGNEQNINLNTSGDFKFSFGNETINNEKNEK